MTAARSSLSLLVLCALTFAPLHGQEAKPAIASGAPAAVDPGTHILRLILNGLRVQPLKSWEDVGEPTRTIILVLGDTSVLNRVPGGVENFVRDGGALVVATDRPLQWQFARGGLFGIHVLPGPVRVPAAAGFRELPDCPFVEDTRAAAPLLFDERRIHNRVATNVSGFLAFDSQGAHLPVRAWFVDSPVLPRDQAKFAPTPLPFAAGGPVGAGKCLILADHSVFINDMMRQRDAGNFYFAIGMVRWLKEGSRAPRDRVLLVENGSINSDFDIPLPRRSEVRGVPLTPEEMEPIIDEFLSELVREPRLANDLVPLFNEALNAVQKSFDPDQALAVVAISLTFGVLLYGLIRTVKGRYRLDLHVPFFSRLLGRQAPVGAAGQQRQAAMLREGQFWEAAQTLACRLFETAPGDDLADIEPPEIEAKGAWFQRWRLRRNVEKLWQLATTDEPRRLSRRAFRRIMEQVRALEAARNEGNLRITWV